MDAPPERWTRERFVKAAGAGALGLALAGGAAYRWLWDDEAEVTTPPPRRGREHTFVTRPDLKPPVVSVVERSDAAQDGLLFLSPPSGPGQRGALIVDDSGEPIWFNPSNPNTTMDFRAAVYKGRPVLTWWEGRHLRGVGLQGSYVIADLARVRPGLPQDGRSIVPLLQGAEPAWRDAFVVEYLGGSMLRQGGPPPYRALRTKRYVYVEYLNGWRELYDLARDPAQLRNRAQDPKYAGTRDLLAQRLRTLFHAPPRVVSSGR